MTEKKESGSYYTPSILSTFLVKHLFNKYIDTSGQFCILEPSCGDGEFVQSLNPFLNDNTTIDLIDINDIALTKAKDRITVSYSKEKINSHNIDFLKHKSVHPYNLIIGNPPYINKKHLTDEQIAICKAICKEKISDIGEVKNIWPAFLIKAIDALDCNGILCYVLPSELLQVKYTSGLRKMILATFDRVEIFAFNELIFDDAEQDVVALIGIKNHLIETEKGVSFYQVDQLKDLTIPNYTEMNFNVHREKLDKWTNYVLPDEDLNFVDQLSNDLSLMPIKYYCKRSEVGIVTAANEFFIRRKSDLLKSDMFNYSKPILQRSNLIKNTINVTSSNIDILQKTDQPINLVCLNREDSNDKSVLEFISKGEEQLLHDRYKLKKRYPWYKVPSVWTSEAIFCKRSHLYPRLLLNEANVLVTDSFYRVVVKPNYNIANLVFSFYNSLTLTLAELEGRFYGGGVLELVPTEFNKLLIPYCSTVSKDQFGHLEGMFNASSSLSEILAYTDPIVLPNVDILALNKLREIRQSLFNRRTKNKYKDEIELKA